MNGRFSAEEKLEAVERELTYRRHVYERRIAAGKMRVEQARYQIALFEQIRDDYRAQAEKERLL